MTAKTASTDLVGRVVAAVTPPALRPRQPQRRIVTRMNGTQTLWRFTTWRDRYRWQSLVAGVLAFLAALIVVGGAAWLTNKRREVDALRVSLAVEIRPPIFPFEGAQQAALKPGQPAEAASGQSELSSEVDGQQAVTPPAPPVSPAQEAALKPGQPAEAASGQSELSSDVEGRQAVTPPAPPVSPAQEAALKPGQPAEAASGQSELSSDVEGRQAVTPPAPPLSPAQEAALKPGQPAEAASGQSELSSDVEGRQAVTPPAPLLSPISPRSTRGGRREEPARLRRASRRAYAKGCPT